MFWVALRPSGWEGFVPVESVAHQSNRGDGLDGRNDGNTYLLGTSTWTAELLKGSPQPRSSKSSYRGYYIITI